MYIPGRIYLGVYTWYTRGAGPRRADAHLGFGVPVMAEDVGKSRS